jgi:uncharacterized protein involved in type VI secretion and phage assembly
MNGSDSGPARVVGVMVGIVLDNRDPQGLGRVKVKFPSLSDDPVGHWARLGALMAGKDRGTFFLPEVGDEVLAVFEQGDISRPYVIGALWNGQDAPPDTNANGQNNLRFLKSRSGHLVRFDDTSGAEKIEIIDKSGNNKVVIDTATNTLTLQSDKDIRIEAAKGKITLNAQKIEINSSADTKVQGQGGLSLDGSPGNTTIKGTMVDIN